MKHTRLNTLARVAATGSSAIALAAALACTSTTSTTTSNSNTAVVTTNTPAPPSGSRLPADNVNAMVADQSTGVRDHSKDPLAPGANDRIIGRIISLGCYKKDPTLSPEAADDCAKQQVEKGSGGLGILASDGSIYIGEEAAGNSLGQLAIFIGTTVVVDGNIHGDAAVDLPNVKVKKMEIKAVHRQFVDMSKVPPGANTNTPVRVGPSGPIRMTPTPGPTPAPPTKKP